MSYLSAEKRAEFAPFRRVADSYIGKIVENPVEINENLDVIRPWAPGVFVAGDVRMHEGAPHKCVQAHDSTGNEAWNPADTPALWMQYHGTTPESARDWITPAGGEYTIWTDGLTYHCLSDTVYSPAAYPQLMVPRWPTSHRAPPLCLFPGYQK